MKRIVSLMTSLTCFVLLGAQYTIVDLFSGIGGLSYGFSQYPEFKVLAANEYDLEIAKAYELNHPGGNHVDLRSGRCHFQYDAEGNWWCEG